MGTIALPESIQAPIRTANDQTVEFVRLGYAGASLDFRTQVVDAETFAPRCMEVMGGYNGKGRPQGAATCQARPRYGAHRAAAHVIDCDVTVQRHCRSQGNRRGLGAAAVHATSGRECSVVLYLYLRSPLSSGPGHMRAVPIPADEREALERRHGAQQEVARRRDRRRPKSDGRPYCVRLWWD